MIDSHCHLEQKDYDKDRDEFIKSLKKELKAVVTSCAHPKDIDLTLEIARKHKNFVFACIGLHPEYIKELKESELGNIIEKIRQHKNDIVGIGEVGLDFNWVKEKEWQEKQRELFVEMISLAKEIRKPLVIHSRNAYEEVIRILEQEDAKEVLLHMWGEKKLVDRINENNFFVSIGPIIARSKNHKRIARDIPIERILLETDSPWFGDGGRGTPLNIKIPCQKIAEVKKLSFEEVWRKCGQNSISFFKLPL